jgi:hypothetical protein
MSTAGAFLSLTYRLIVVNAAIWTRFKANLTAGAFLGIDPN